jgi:hypothetical protein
VGSGQCGREGGGDAGRCGLHPPAVRYAVNFFVVVLLYRKELVQGGSKRRGIMPVAADFWEARDGPLFSYVGGVSW